MQQSSPAGMQNFQPTEAASGWTMAQKLKLDTIIFYSAGDVKT